MITVRPVLAFLDQPGFLGIARRLLAPVGQLVVTTPFAERLLSSSWGDLLLPQWNQVDAA